MPETGREGVTARASAGFTLIELAVVILIIAMAAALVIPRLPAPEGMKLKSSARNLASGIRFLNDQAIVTKGRYVLHMNVGESGIRIARVSAAGDEMPADDQFMNRQLIDNDVVIEDVITSDLGKVSDGELVVRFGPNGNEQFLTLHLKAGDKEMTVYAFPNGGKVRVVDGYQTLETEQESRS